MIDSAELQTAIDELKDGKATMAKIEKLAMLYIVLDHADDRPMPEYSFAKSEFTQAASAVPFESLLDILDDHMTAIKQVYPKEYAKIMMQLESQK